MKNRDFNKILEGSIKATNKAKKNSVVGNKRAEIKQGAHPNTGPKKNTGLASKYQSPKVKELRYATYGKHGDLYPTGPGAGLKKRQSILKQRLKAKHMKNESFMNILEGAVKAANKAKKNAAVIGVPKGIVFRDTIQTARRIAKSGSNTSAQHPTPKKYPARKVGKSSYLSAYVSGGKHGKSSFAKDSEDQGHMKRLMKKRAETRKLTKMGESFMDILEGAVKAANKAKKNKYIKGSNSNETSFNRMATQTGSKSPLNTKYKPGRATRFGKGTDREGVTGGKHGFAYMTPPSSMTKTQQQSLKQKLKVKHMKNEEFMDILEGAVKAANKRKKNLLQGATLNSKGNVGQFRHHANRQKARSGSTASNALLTTSKEFRGDKKRPATAKTNSTNTKRIVTGGRTGAVAKTLDKEEQKGLKFRLAVKHGAKLINKRGK